MAELINTRKKARVTLTTGRVFVADLGLRVNGNPFNDDSATVTFAVGTQEETFSGTEIQTIQIL